MWCPGSAEWLYCKTRVCGVSSAIQDLDQCAQYTDCTETRLIRDALVLMKPSVDFLDGRPGQFWAGCGGPEVRTFGTGSKARPLDWVADAALFYAELLARLRCLATPFPSLIGRLCGQCEARLLACPRPVLVPRCSFLQPPGGALQHTLSGLCAGEEP